MGDRNGVYGQAGRARPPEREAHLAHYAQELGGNPAFQKMVQAVADHWPSERYGFNIHDRNAFADRNGRQPTLAEKALWGVFRAYDSVSRSGEMTPLLLAVQDAARAEFGLRGTINTATPAERAAARRDFASAQPGLRLLLRQMYNETQAYLERHGVTSVVLFRGTRFAPGNEPPGVAWNNRIETRTIQSRPLSSWATNLYTASTFANAWSREYDDTYHGYGLTSGVTVPASRIFSLEHTGFGHKDEAEVVVLGGADKALVRAEHPIETINSIDTDAGYRAFAHASRSAGSHSGRSSKVTTATGRPRAKKAAG